MLYDKRWEVKEAPVKEYEALSMTAPRLGPIFTKAVVGMRKQVNNGCIVSWNDQPYRTKEEVIAALEAAAKQEV